MILTDSGNRSAGDIPVTVTLCPPQNSHGLIRDQTRGSAVRPAGDRPPEPYGPSSCYN